MMLTKTMLSKESIRYADVDSKVERVATKFVVESLLKIGEHIFGLKYAITGRCGFEIDGDRKVALYCLPTRYYELARQTALRIQHCTKPGNDTVDVILSIHWSPHYLLRTRLVGLQHQQIR